MRHSLPIAGHGYRGRFAPSPSGPLHLGSLLTALASFLEARSRGGEWLVRIDDVDTRRTRPGAADDILRSLEALGLCWDGAVLHQQQRLDRYREALESLRSLGLIYACACSRRELAVTQVGGIYPGTCRDQHYPAQTGRHALRVSTNATPIRFEDRVQGEIVQNLAREVGDFVVFRRDGDYAYHLATVVDDADQGITDILRGRDLLDSTPRQIYLQQQLDLPTPTYAHTPILMDASGHKLSKRTLAPEAETRHPQRLLDVLLGWLRHPLPTPLKRAPVTEILNWAIADWRLERLRQVGPITIDPESLNA